MPIIAGQTWAPDALDRARERGVDQADERDRRLMDLFDPDRRRPTPRQASVSADTLGNVQGAAPVANRNGWPVGVVASDPARFAAEDRRRRLDAVTDPDTSRYLSDPTRNALVGDDIEATNTLGASIKRLLRNTTTSLVSGLTAGQYDHPENVTNYLAGIGTPRTAGHDLWLTVKQSARRTDAAVLEAPFTLGDAVINPWQVRATSALLSQLSDRFNVPARSIPRPDAIRGTQAELYRTNADEYQAEASEAKIRRDRSRSSTFTGVLGDYWDHPQLAAEDALGSTVAMGLGGAGLGPLTIPALAATQASDAQLQIKQTLQQRNPGMSEAELDSRAAEVAPLLVGAGLVFPQASHGAGLIENFMSGQFRRNAERAVARNAVDFGVRATARRVVGNVGAEVLSEMGEEGTIQLGQNVATGDPVFHGVGGAMASGAVLATGMSGPIAGYEEHAMRVADARRRAAIDYVANAIGSASDVNNLVALTRAAASAKLTEVDPAEAAAFARDHMAGGDGNVYVPVSEVAALYQDPAEQQAAFEALTGNATAAMDASVTGDIAVPLDRWVSQVARLPRAEELAGVAKLAPGALSNKDLQAFTPEQIQEDLARYYAESAEDSERTSGPEGEVYDSFYGDLLPHYGQEGAARVAATMQAFYRTMGARIGVDAKTLFDRFRINIGGKRRGNPGVVPRDVDTTLDPMIDAAINGKAFSDDEIHGNAGGVISAILAAGGIRPDSVGADDLRSLQSLPPGFFNANGRTAEAMAEALAEDGWRGSFTDVDSYGRPGSNELSELVRRELFGDKVRPDMDGADQDRATKREAINNDIATVRDAFKRYEAETGIDPATLPREQQREIALGGLNALNQSSDDGFSEEGRRQYLEAEKAYGGRTAYDKAKAGGKTKLTYGQWVQVRTPAFLEWFGDWMNDPANASKVIDPKTGEPMVVYHATNGDFNAFSESKRSDGFGYYFGLTEVGAKKAATGKGRIIAAFIKADKVAGSMKTPAADWLKMRFDGIGRRLAGEGFDAAYIKDEARGALVVRNPNQIKSATANIGDFSEDPNILRQRGANRGPRGQIVGRDGQSIIGQKAENGSREFNITLFEGKDLSTVLHEAGHAFFEIFGDLAEDANASEQLKADYQTLLEASGAKTRADVGREQHEWIARSFEAYTRDGKAPSSSLRRAFAMFGTFLTRIYKVLSALNVNLTPEVRAVFDRMLASEEEIAEAQRAQSMEPLLREFDGWTPEQKAAYEAAVIDARGEAERRLAAEVLRAQQRAEKAWQGEERKKVKAQVEADMRALPVYRAIRWLRNGKLPDGSEVPVKLKLSKQLLLDDYGPEILKSLRGLYSKDGGDSADSVAAALGFLSGREMIDQMAKAPSLQDVVKADTDNIMAERYPDPMNDGSMAERAQNKVHSSKQRELMLMEINALERRAGRPPTQMQIMREAVKRILGGRPARAIAPGGYRAAEAKYGRMAFDALAKGDHAGALEARRQQMLNSLLYSEATKIRAEVEKAGKLFNRYTKKRTRAKVGKVGGTYLEQIDALLERFDFRQVSGPQSKRRMALRDWIDARLADGLPADFPKRLMDDAYRTPYKDMTVDQIRELRDAVVSIAYWASMKGNLLLAGELRSRKAIDIQMEASVLAGSKAQPDVPGHVDDSAFMKLWGEARRHIAAATDMARRLDGYVDLGAVWTNTVGVIRDAVSNNLNPALRQARETIAKLYLDNYTRSEIAHFKDLRTIAGVRGVWSRENILAVALNWGNEENRLAILTQERGRPTPEEVGRLLQTLTPKDWDFVEGVWQAIDAYWPQIAAAQRRRKGLAPKKVEASSFVVTLPDGTQRTIRGGYYPLKYTGSLHSDANEAEDFFKSVQSGTFSSVSTRDGHTQERVGSAGQSPRLDLGVIDQHMRGVLYDLHMGDAVNYVHRVLHGSRFKRAVEDTGHRELLHGMEDWLRDVATGEMPAHGYETGIRFLRQNFTAAVLGFKATTALLQVTGALTTATVLGKKATLAGISRYKSNPVAMTKYVREQSAYMDQRVGTTVDVVRELSSARDGALKRAYDWQMRWAYVGIGFLQQIVDVQAWLGAESKGLEMFDGDIKKARAYADDIVSRSQGSQEWMDKNSLQRGTVGNKIKQAEVIRAFTTLGGYMIVKHNAIVEQVTKAKGDVTGINLKSVGVGLNLALNLCILMYADALVSGLIRGDLPDDDDDEFMKKWFEFFTGEGFASLFGAVPGIGALVSKAKGYDVESVTVNLWGDAVKAWDQAWQGEADMALARSLVTVAGDVTGIPASQINATLRAVEASDDGRDISPIDYLRGPPRH